MIRLHDGMGEAAIFDVAPVDEQVDLGASGAGEGQGTDVATYEHRAGMGR